MDPVRDGFAAAIARAEKTLRQKRRAGQETPQERGHAVVKLGEERAKRRAEEARQFVQDARRLGLDVETLGKIEEAAKAHAQDPEGWSFVMLGPAQNEAVVRWIAENSKRPHKAHLLWAALLGRLDWDTGEVRATRQDLAERVGVRPTELSQLMGELASINAVRREKQGRGVRYFLNPWIATHVPSAQGRSGGRQEAGPLLRVMEGGGGRDGV
jgi:DNA-binding transcriptional ArsR family regulator